MAKNDKTKGDEKEQKVQQQVQDRPLQQRQVRFVEEGVKTIVTASPIRLSLSKGVMDGGSTISAEKYPI